MLRRTLLIGMLALAGLAGSAPVLAQAPVCGVVDAIDYPIDITDTLRQRYDDFALFRPRFFGNHTGIDIGFNRWGEPVRAAARGEVTLSNITEWDTEKGVVIVRHTFPDNSIAYSVYGHMEQGETVFFPPVGSCVERGDVLGLIGWPSRGLPHLHYEIRAILPSEGGPGYVEDNPLDDGWYHPLDFTELWRARLQPGFIQSRTFAEAPALAPIALNDGTTVIALDQRLVGTLNGATVWQITTDGVVTGIAALPGGRVAAHTANGQALVLQGSRFVAIWEVDGPDVPFVSAGETLIFVTPGGGLSAFDPAGNLRWQADPLSDPTAAAQPRLVEFRLANGQVALGLRSADGTRWRLFDAGSGALLYSALYEGQLTSAFDGSGWLMLNETALNRIRDGAQTRLATFSPPIGRTARLAVSSAGDAYAYLGDAEATLMAFDSAGSIRWRETYPVGSSSLAPLMATANCALYTLDADGMLNVFDAGSGSLLTQRQLYAGGQQTASPRARLLTAEADGTLWVGGGFLSIAEFDGAVLSAQACAGS